MLKKIISGGQTGADIGGIKAAHEKGLETGGILPLGYKTQDGPKPEYATLYGMREHKSDNYVPRTMENVRDSDATIRIAADINSPGEKTTLRGINQYNKPHFDVHVTDPKAFTAPEPMQPKVVAKWIFDNNIEVLNVAGNSERTAPGMEAYVRRFVSVVIDEVRKLEAEALQVESSDVK